MPIASASPEPAVVGERYRLIERLAKGGMGEVYVAHDPLEGQCVALKLLREAAGAQAALLQHFRLEYRALKSLQHPRIIRVYDFGFHAGRPYYTMELLDGEDLRALAPLCHRKACRYLRDVASSIALLHARRLLHRDLSPRNVRRTSDGRCKLIDFGTMTPFGDPPNVAGTPPLLPPEAMRQEHLDQRADLYSLGALAYWLLTGRHAYPVRHFRELPVAWETPPPRMRRFDDRIPSGLDDLVLSLLDSNPKARPASAAEVIELLGAYGGLDADDSPELAESYLATTALVGRGGQLARIERHVLRAMNGRGGVLHVQAPPGGGKSRLLEEAVLVARTHGLLPLQVGARELSGPRFVTVALTQALEAAAPTRAHEECGDVATASSAASPPPGASGDQLGGNEARVRLQAHLTDRVTAVADAQPLLVAVDDLDRADEFSVAFVAALALEAASVPVLVMATTTHDASGVCTPAFQAFSRSAHRMALSPLDEEETRELIASSFGAVTHVARAASWVFRYAHGNPAMSEELIRHLASTGWAHYAAGTWVLSDDEVTEQAPLELRRALNLRLSRLSSDARKLAQLIAVYGSSASRMLIEAAAELPRQSVECVLAELVHHGMLVHSQDSYTFRLEVVREAALLGLRGRDERQIHARLASALQSSTDDDLRTQFQAGWHQSHTTEELRGADVLARLGPRALRSGVSSGIAVDAMERALVIYERHCVPPTVRLRLLSMLVVCGFHHDPKLAERYGEPVIHELYRAGGLHLADRWARWLGPRLSALCAIGWASLRRLLQPAVRRPPAPLVALVYLGRALTALMGTRASLLDGPGTAALAPYAEALARTGLPVVAQVAGVCRVSRMQPLGCESELRSEVEVVLAQVEALRGRFAGANRESWDELHLAMLFVKGINAAFRPGRDALAIADQVEARGDQAARICAERLRMAYHAVRGQRQLTERALGVLELHAVRGGTIWQANAFWHPIAGLSGALYGDVVAVRRALDRLEAMVVEFPALTSMRDLVTIGYHYARGDYRQAVGHGLPFVSRHPPRTTVGWAVGYAMTAIGLTELGRYQEASDLARGSFEAIPEEDHAYFALYMPPEGALALTEALAGNDQLASEIFDRMEARVMAENEHSVAALIHQSRVRIARMKGDLEALRASLNVMSELAESSCDPVLIAHVDRIAGLSTRMTNASDRPGPVGLQAYDMGNTAVEPREATLVTRVLKQSEGADERALSALQLLAQCAGALRGHLMVSSEQGAKVVAQLGHLDPPQGLEARMAQLLRRGRAGTQGTLLLGEDHASSTAGPGFSRGPRSHGRAADCRGRTRGTRRWAAAPATRTHRTGRRGPVGHLMFARRDFRYLRASPGRASRPLSH